MTPETLAPDIAWEPSGHLSDVALSAFADGEDALLDAAMHAHLDGCEACAIELGNVAMRSANVASALRDPALIHALHEIAEAAPSAVLEQARSESGRSIASDVQQSIANDVQQSITSDVPQSIASDVQIPVSVAEASPIGVAPSWVPPTSVRAPKSELVKARKVPLGLLFPVMALAAIGAAPSMIKLPAQIAAAWSVVRDVAPALVRIAPAALSKAWSGPRGATVVMVTWMLAAALVAAGLGIAMKQSKKLAADGGRR